MKQLNIILLSFLRKIIYANNGVNRCKKLIFCVLSSQIKKLFDTPEVKNCPITLWHIYHDLGASIFGKGQLISL